MADMTPNEVLRTSATEMFKRLGINRVIIVDDQYAEAKPGVEELIGLCTGLGALKASALLTGSGIAETSDIEILDARIKEMWPQLEVSVQRALVEKLQSEVGEGALLDGHAVAVTVAAGTGSQTPFTEPPKADASGRTAEAATPADVSLPADTNVNGTVTDDDNARNVLEDLLGGIADCPLITMSLATWSKDGDRLLKEAEAKTTLFLFDRDFGRENASADEGFKLIRQAQTVPEVRCGMLTHTVELDGEYRAWETLAADQNVDRNRFILIAKARLIGGREDLSGFVGMLRLTALSGQCKAIKDAAWRIFQESVTAAQGEVDKLSVYDFDQVVLASSRREGVWEPETLFRVFAIFMRMQAREQMYGNDDLARVVVDARAQSAIANQDTDLREILQKARLGWKIQQYEMFEPGRFINGYNLPIELGDIFEDSWRKYILLAQPCDLMVRQDGKRSFDDNKDAKCVFLVELVGQKSKDDERERFAEVPLFDEASGDSAFLDFQKIHSVRLCVVDLCAFSSNGAAKIEIGAVCPGRLIEPWQNRYKILQRRFKKVVEDNESINKWEDGTKGIKALALPTASNTGKFSPKVSTTGVEFDLRRVRRLKQPRSGVLLTRLMQFHSRAAFEHNLGFPLPSVECIEDGEAEPVDGTTQGLPKT